MSHMPVDSLHKCLLVSPMFGQKSVMLSPLVERAGEAGRFLVLPMETVEGGQARPLLAIQDMSARTAQDRTGHDQGLMKSQDQGSKTSQDQGLRTSLDLRPERGLRGPKEGSLCTIEESLAALQDVLTDTEVQETLGHRTQDTSPWPGHRTQEGERRMVGHRHRHRHNHPPPLHHQPAIFQPNNLVGRLGGRENQPNLLYNNKVPPTTCHLPPDT